MLNRILATPVGLPITAQNQPDSVESWKSGAQTKSMACMAGFQLGEGAG